MYFKWYLRKRIWGEEKVHLQPDDVNLLFLGYDVIITNYVISTYGVRYEISRVLFFFSAWNLFMFKILAQVCQIYEFFCSVFRLSLLQH